MSNIAPLIAAIDAGTNSFHLLVTSVNSRGMLQIITREREAVRLGSSGSDMKLLTPEAMERGLKTISNFAKIARSHKAEIRAVATSAVREANNKHEFIEKVLNETGVEIEIVSGAEEARLIYIGAIHALPIIDKKALVIDIGGGSTETIVGMDGNINYINSVKLGAIRLTTRFFPDSNITFGQIEECRNFINGEWAPTLSKIKEQEVTHFIGTSGTIQNLAMISLAMRNEVIPDILNGLTVSREHITKAINEVVSAKTLKERGKIPGIDPTRTDIIVGGALILEKAIKELNIEKITISAFALREGIVFDTVQKQQAITEYKHLSSLRYETVIAMCHRFSVKPEHSEFVKNISLKIFDGLKSLHKFTYYERELLEAAALLHDVGYHISHDYHHKHSYYIICQSIMPGFTNDESEVIANIARYHRKSHPKAKHENFLKLTEHKQLIVKILSGILRIAEGTDRRQLQLIKDVKVKINNLKVEITFVEDKNKIEPDIEFWGATRRKLLLEEALDVKINFNLEKES